MDKLVPLSIQNFYFSMPNTLEHNIYMYILELPRIKEEIRKIVAIGYLDVHAKQHQIATRAKECKLYIRNFAFYFNIWEKNNRTSAPRETMSKVLRRYHKTDRICHVSG